MGKCKGLLPWCVAKSTCICNAADARRDWKGIRSTASRNAFKHLLITGLVAFVAIGSAQAQHLLYDFDFNVSNQGFIIMGCVDPGCIVDGMEEWSYGPYDGLPPAIACHGVPVGHNWGVALGGAYRSPHSCCCLSSPPMYLYYPACSTYTVEVCHWMHADPSPTEEDGGNVKIDDCMGPVLPVTAGHAYDDTCINECPLYTCYVDGQPGFTGHYGSWVLSYFDLTPYADDTVRLFFTFGSDDPQTLTWGWYLKWVRVYCDPETGAEERRRLDLPRTVHLAQNQPNPFTNLTRITFALTSPTPVKLEIFNVSGRLVKTLVVGKMDAGNHAVMWDGRNEKGKLLPSSVYFYRLKAGDFTDIQKMILLHSFR